MSRDLSQMPATEPNHKIPEDAQDRANKWAKIRSETPVDQEVINADAVTLETKPEDNEPEPVAASEAPSMEALQADNVELAQKLQAVKLQVAETQKALQYLEAKRQNELRMAAEDKKNVIFQTEERIISPILEIIDGFETSLNYASLSSTTLAQLQEGVQQLHTLGLNTFEKLGVQVIDPKLDEIFNPYLHSALLTETGKEGQAPNTIVRVLQKGYQLKGRIIRPAMVVVSKPSEN